MHFKITKIIFVTHYFYTQHYLSPTLAHTHTFHPFFPHLIIFRVKKITFSFFGGGQIITFQWLPIIFFVKDENGNILDTYGVEMELVKSIAEVMNFKIVIQEPLNGNNEPLELILKFIFEL